MNWGNNNWRGIICHKAYLGRYGITVLFFFSFTIPSFYELRQFRSLCKVFSSSIQCCEVQFWVCVFIVQANGQNINRSICEMKSRKIFHLHKFHCSRSLSRVLSFSLILSEILFAVTMLCVIYTYIAICLLTFHRAIEVGSA